MKKLLSLLSTTILVVAPVSLTTACSTSKAGVDWSSDDVVPQSGWPPVQEDFLPIWYRFVTKVQEDIAANIWAMFNIWIWDYQGYFNKYKLVNRDKRNLPGYDEYGVPNEDNDKIKAHVATSKPMHDYQKNSLRLYYMEIQICKMEGRPKQVTDDEAQNIWAMKYFRSYPFYDSVQIPLNDFDGPVIHQVAMEYNFYDFGQYIPGDEDPEWNLPPVGAENFHPILKLSPEYEKMADEIYDELFGKGNQND